MYAVCLSDFRRMPGTCAVISLFYSGLACVGVGGSYIRGHVVSRVLVNKVNRVLELGHVNVNRIIRIFRWTTKRGRGEEMFGICLFSP